MLISFVERWNQVGQPTGAALLAQVDALIALCMMDRAWTRLQALPDDTEPLLRAKLTARMFIARGWPNRARSAVDQALKLAPDDAEVTELARDAATPPRPPPLDPPDAAAPFAVQLHAAEAYLATGAYLRARRILENLDRMTPGEPRVGDLLWALQGDYELAGTTLARVVAHYIGNIGAGDLQDLPDEAEPTDSDVTLLDDEPSIRATEFPALFRGGRSDDDAHLDDNEDTQATHMPDFNEEIPTSVDGEDTQVLRVIKSGMGSDAYTGDRPSTPGAEELEEEDDVVVLLRRGDKHGPPKARRPLPPPPSQRRARMPVRSKGGAAAGQATIEVMENLDEVEVDADGVDEVEAQDVDGSAQPDLMLLVTAAVGALLGASALIIGVIVWLTLRSSG